MSSKLEFNDEEFSRILSDPLYAKDLYISNDFQLLKETDYPPYAKQIYDIASKAFWEVIDESTSILPNNDRMLKLLESAKSILLSVAGTKNEIIKQDIENALQLNLIKEELQNNTLNLKYRLELVVSIMGKICSPARDKEILELKQNLEPSVSFLKHFFKVLDNMRIDMCNFLLKYYRKKIIENCVKFEKNIFYKCLDDTNHIVLIRTRNWLFEAIKCIEKTNTDHAKLDKVTLSDQHLNAILDCAYVNLLSYEDTLYPETVSLDFSRLKILTAILNCNIFVASLLNLLKKQISQIKPYDDYIEYNVVEIIFSSELLNMEEKDENKIINDISNNILNFIENQLTKYSLDKMTNSYKEFFTTKLIQMKNTGDPVWVLFEKRIKEAIFNANSNENDLNASLHFSIHAIAKSVIFVRKIFLRFISFNMAVYHDYYSEIIKELLVV